MTGARRPPKCVAILVAAAACVTALAIALPRAPAAEGASVCAQKTPTQLKFARQAGKRHGRLSWHARRAARGRFRVLRNGAIVGQTHGRSMRVAVRPGNQYVFSVSPLNASGSVSNCAGELAQTLRWYPPFRVRHVSVKRVRKLRATLSWAKVRRGDGRLAGYRVYRDGIVYRQVKPRRRSVPVRVTPGMHVFRVIAADTRGAMGQPSRTVRVRVRHSAPTVPGPLRVGKVSDTTVELGWGGSRKRSSPIAGYRIFRNGVPIAQVSALTTEVGNLAPATGYRFSVAAVDRWGYLSRSTTAQTTTAMPPPTQGNLHAFLLATTDESFVDLQRHYRQVGTVYPTYFDCRRSDAGIIGKDDPLVTRWAQMRRIAVLPRFNCQHGPTLNTMLRNPSVREATMANLTALVQQHGYDGINLDFEAGFETDRDVLTTFVAELGRRLHALGKRLTVEVSAKFYATQTGRSGFYDYPQLGRAADHVFVMAWGWHWRVSGPGPLDTLENVLKVANYVNTMPNKQRFVLGMPLYGADWPWSGGPSNPSTPREYAELAGIARSHGATPRLDANSYTWTFNYAEGGVPHEVWFGDATTVSRRIRVARVRGLGLGFWRLGSEDQRIWEDPQIAPGTVWP
jgi:spore germination protein YaaH